jgi:hypothetical protein
VSSAAVTTLSAAMPDRTACATTRIAASVAALPGH